MRKEKTTTEKKKGRQENHIRLSYLGGQDQP